MKTDQMESGRDRSGRIGRYPVAEAGRRRYGQNGQFASDRARHYRPIRSGVAGLILVIGIAACGGGAASGTDQPGPTRAALQAAGWTVIDGTGMKPRAGGAQLAFFNATNPQGVHVALQFLDSDSRAMKEVILDQQNSAGFRGDAIGSVLAFSQPSPNLPLSATVQSELRQALKT